MSLDASASEWAVRLSDQLKTLSELAESLTYRMLELEERLSGQEDQLICRQLAAEQRHGAVAETMEARLRQTEDRLGHIELLLREEKQPSGSPPSLRAVPTPLNRKPNRFSNNALPEEEDSMDSPHGKTRSAEDHAITFDHVDQSRAS